MTKNRWLTLVGVLILLIPFLGLPSSYKSFLMIVGGLAVITLAFSFARQKRMLKEENVHSAPEYSTDVFAQSRPVQSRTERVRSVVMDEIDSAIEESGKMT